MVAALQSAWQDPQVALLLVLYPLFLFLGVYFLLALVEDHGSVTAAASAVVRKIASFTVSYLYFGRPLTPAIVIGALFVFSSVGVKAFWGYLRCARVVSPR